MQWHSDGSVIVQRARAGEPPLSVHRSARWRHAEHVALPWRSVWAAPANCPQSAACEANQLTHCTRNSTVEWHANKQAASRAGLQRQQEAGLMELGRPDPAGGNQLGALQHGAATCRRGDQVSVEGGLQPPFWESSRHRERRGALGMHHSANGLVPTAQAPLTVQRGRVGRRHISRLPGRARRHVVPARGRKGIMRAKQLHASLHGSQNRSRCQPPSPEQHGGAGGRGDLQHAGPFGAVLGHFITLSQHARPVLPQPAPALGDTGLPAAHAGACACAHLAASPLPRLLQAQARLGLQFGHAVASGVRKDCKGRKRERSWRATPALPHPQGTVYTRTGKGSRSTHPWRRP